MLSREPQGTRCGGPAPLAERASGSICGTDTERRFPACLSSRSHSERPSAVNE